MKINITYYKKSLRIFVLMTKLYCMLKEIMNLFDYNNEIAYWIKVRCLDESKNSKEKLLTINP